MVRYFLCNMQKYVCVFFPVCIYEGYTYVNMLWLSLCMWEFMYFIMDPLHHP